MYMITTIGCPSEQVRERMRIAKETLLAPVAAAAASMVAAARKPGHEAEDDACVICLDQAADVIFQPCSHCVTCTACAKLVAQRKQPCPMCRTAVSSFQKMPVGSR